MSRPAEGGPKHAWRANWYAVKLIEPCREVARQHGYAITEHGSKARDIDWVAIPWVEDCASPRVLAEAVIKRIGEVHDGANYCMAFAEQTPVSWTPERIEWERNGCAGEKPHGRLTWTIHLGGGPYIDLSVMPPQRTQQEEEKPMSVRAKFYVTSINHIYNGGGTEIVQVKMSPIFEGKDGVDGNTNENRMFAKHSPSGTFELMITNPEAFKHFEIGKNYYFDITPAG